jgi:pimeloyl-ACP methyl ester carboxylesterase
MAISQRLQEWISSGRHETLLGRQVFVRTETGPGREPLLLIHGYPTASYDWHALWPALRERHSLYAIDMLGFGMSSKPRHDDYLIATQADLCMALLDSHGVARPHVLAHDYGDTVAQELLAREREGRLKLASVCFLNGGLFPETHLARPVQKALANPVLGPVLARLMSERSFARTLRGIWGETPPSAAELHDLWWLVEREGGRVAVARMINYMAQRRAQRPRWVGALVESGVPRRLICGAADPVSGRHLAERYRELVPGADVVVLEGVGHYPQLEAPDAVLREYCAFRDGLVR